jgi:cytochrome c peroxidase
MSKWVLASAICVLLVGCGGGGDSGSSTPQTLPVTAPNRAPVVASANPDQTATVGVAFQYDASRAGAVFTDADGNTLTYRVTIAPTTSGLAVSGTTVSGTPTTAGTYRVTITADDSRGGTASDDFDIVVAPPPNLPVLPTTAFQYSDAGITLPRQFTTGPGNPSAADNTPANNPVSNAGATLGRVLFYDKRLSINDAVSCGSCHTQSRGFSDAARFSLGFQGGRTARHSMGLANSRYYQRGRFFWDERAATLEAQVLEPIQDSTEMGMTLPQLVTKLAGTNFYGPLFTAAFGDPQITSDRISRALAQFVRAMVSYRSKYDSAFVNGVPNFAATLTAQEETGRTIFEGRARCGGCHGTIAHVSDNIHNNGLDAVTIDAGAGNGRFKSPSLRNIAVRPPFMHDGRFTTLREVIDHYDAGVQNNPNLSPALRAPDGTPRRLNLTEAEKLALIAFLGTLTDNALLTDPKFADPFPR